MKYEAVLGNQDLFDGVSCAAIIVIKSNGTGRYTITENECSDIIKLNVCQPDIEIAMRRIIQEPKRWTIEDQKAGRLPDVGAEVQFNFYQSSVVRQGIIKYIDEQVAVIQTEDVTRPFCYETCKVVFTPLETPEEKAQREEKEFVRSFFGYRDFDINIESNPFVDGLLAAYRKLKGGE